MGNPRPSAPVRAVVGLTISTLAAGLAVLAPAPAQATPPTVTGDYATVTATPFRVLSDLDECSETVELHVEMDLVGLGNEVQGAGYRTKSGDPVYTTLQWSWENRITGPDGYYSSKESSYHDFPDAADGWNVTLCPDRYGHDRVVPGTYTMTGTVTVENRAFADICQGSDCQRYPQLYRKPFTVTFEVTSTCPEATAAHAQAKKNVTKATKAVKKAHGKKATRKAKKKLAAAKQKLAKAREVKASAC
jgi:hypothetical protein